MKNQKYIEFTCSKCGSHSLLEVRTNVTSYARVRNIGDGGSADTDLIETSDGTLMFQCFDCDSVVINEDGKLITNYSQLIKKFKNTGKGKKK
jgi:hypothetical protein